MCPDLVKIVFTCSMCGGCKSAVDHGRSVNVSGVLWHPKCLICHACDKKIAIHEVENHVRKNSSFEIAWYFNLLLNLFILFFA